MFKETIGNYCENRMKKVHTLCGKVQGSLELRQLAHIVTAGHQKIRTTQYVSPLTGLQGESSTSRLCISSSGRQYFFSERPVQPSRLHGFINLKNTVRIFSVLKISNATYIWVP